MEYRVVHKTRYDYTEPVNLCHNEVRLIPRTLAHQTLDAHWVTVDPVPSAFKEREDFFGNRVCYFSIQQPHKTLTVTVTSQVRVEENAAAPLPEQPVTWETARDRLLSTSDSRFSEVFQYTVDSPSIPASQPLKDYAQPSFTPGRPLREAAHDLMQRIHRDFEFKPGFTSVSTPLETVLTHRRGVCQDFAQLAIGAVRSMGLAARYVSGYLETLPPPGKKKLQGADVSHAWFSVYIPDEGWLDLDPTNNMIPSTQHITAAWGRDFSDVSPVKGVIFGSGSHTLEVSVDVERRV